MNVLAFLVLLFVGIVLLAVLLFKFVLPLLAFLGALLFGLTVVVLYIGSIIWAFNDANMRGKPGWAVALLVAITFLPGLLVWIVFRPEKKSDRVNLDPSVYPSASVPPQA